MIISKVSCFDVKGPWWVFPNNVSAISDLCSAGNVDALLDDVAGSDDILLVYESELSSDESIIISSAIQTCSSSPIA